MERRPVEMVRLEKEEEKYDVEEVLGRDASSVFPSMNKQLDPMQQLKAAIGAKRFVTETELDEIKKARGLNVDDGTAAADKPLAEILAERKQAKQEAFEEQWKQMKTGKNRPLDPDELDFLDSLAQQEAAQQRMMQQQEAEELEAYRLAVAAAAEAKAAAAAAAGDGGDEAAAADVAAAAGPGPSSTDLRSGSGGAAKAQSSRIVVNSKPALPVLKPVLKVKPKNAAAGPASQAAAAAAASGDKQLGQSSKRPRLEQSAGDQQQQQGEQAAAGSSGLAGLLGGYGSGSEDADS